MTSTNDTHQNTLIEQLSQQLREFGLNPRDWKIMPKGHDRYKVQYSDDASWFFYGQSQMQNHPQEKAKWSYLKLISI